MRSSSQISFKLWQAGMAILILFIAGLFFGKQFFSSDGILDRGSQEIREGGYTLINPLLECEATEATFKELRPFQEKIQAFIQQQYRENDNVDFVSVYFRDLNNGPWFGVNQDETFSPASLLKVPLMMAYYKQAETDPSVLKQSFTFRNDSTIPGTEQTILPTQVIEQGIPYTVEELIYRMIVYSDNKAQHVLVSNMDYNIFKKVYFDFGLSLPSVEIPETQVSVQAYAGFFRMLFNASYLGRTYSEKALEMLSQSGFRDGLVAGVPAGTTIAHKFGERQQGISGVKQLHDCGIVYYSGHPYLLCVMTRGKDNKQLAGVIRNVSQLVYEEINKQFNRK